ncbi:hypothetical protein M409DRAFT_57229 [Zasmidium cellare ATCC 36951]|uniref:Uncharacterized protein n=1 Tax=Zasmidium cellare ATCC 36951 TaxID=1080233 RepID=A0A6A6CDH1_ZASCE|nr:uncharacterized protein M409DRAFT_57229 [Zasmidium cellare ATCC 36951]KAF2163739.1 hypothetical protein M409DRAFT_57229 [Zasmidium cellare ATCC 36951]
MSAKMATWLLIASISFLLCFATPSAQAASLMGPVAVQPQEYYRPSPLPRCEECPSVDQLRAPGIGLALEIDHGTAVVRLHEWELYDVALIEGDADFTALMRKYATGPINRRLSNKLLGRPATPETAILASIVSKLIKATQTWLDDEHAVAAAVLSSPDHIALTDEEIGDVFDYLKINNLMKVNDPNPLYQLYATSAAYAGYGKGLCHTYTDAYECEREEWKFPEQRVLHVDLNLEALSGTIKGLQTAKDGSVSASFVDPDLGLVRLVLPAADDTEQYWTAVSNRIRELAKTLERYVYMPYVTQLLLTGPSATNERFQAAVREALHDLVRDENVLDVLEHDNMVASKSNEWKSLFTFATARGAAEIAKRRQGGPVNCAQSDECRRRREDVHGEPQPALVKQRPEL